MDHVNADAISDEMCAWRDGDAAGWCCQLRPLQLQFTCEERQLTLSVAVRKDAALASPKRQRRRRACPAGAACVLQQAAATLSDGTGFERWAAPETLCRTLARHPALVRGRRVVELGAGVGTCGLLAGALGAAAVALTDVCPHVLAALRAAAVANRLEPLCSVRALDWSAPLLQPADRGGADVVLAAEVCYVSAASAALARVVAHLLAPRGCLLLAHRERRSEAEQGAHAPRAGWIV